MPTDPMPPDCDHCARLGDPACKTVVLLSGPTVCTYCPAWREETRERQEEANRVLGFIDRETSIAHLDEVERTRGAEARKRLEAVIMDAWRRRRAAVKRGGR